MKQIQQMKLSKKTICRINHVDGGFYKIIVAMNLVGAICISQKETPSKFWISPMFIHPSYQGKGIAQKGTYIN